MNRASYGSVPLLLAAWLGLAGCGGTKLLRDPAPPIDVSSKIAAQDARLEVKIAAVIVRNGPGSWAQAASWDEYLIRARNASTLPLRVTGVGILDSSGARAAPQRERSDLTTASQQTERRYKSAGWIITPGSGQAGPVVAGVMASTAAAALGAATSASTSAGMMGGVAATGAAAATVVLGGAVLIGYGINRAVNNYQVNEEIGRRATTLPVTLAAEQELVLDLFFAYSPSPSRLELAYEDAAGAYRLDIDTRAALAGLHLGPDPALIEALAPMGKLRLAFVSAPAYATFDQASGQSRGVGVDLGGQMASRLGVPLEAVPYPSFKALMTGARFNQWDVALAEIGADRAGLLEFSSPYMEVERAVIGGKQVDRIGMAVPKRRDTSGATYVGDFIRQAKAAGAVQAAIDNAGLAGATVAPSND
jgi:hypothetical protein